MHEDYFKKFVMIIRSAGFISPDLIRSQNALNFAYIIYLKLREDKVPQAEIARLVSRWFVYSVNEWIWWVSKKVALLITI